jgi:hypothetical protein
LIQTATPLPGGELVLNGGFDNGTADWDLGQYEGGEASYNIENGVCHVAINNGGGDVWHVQLVQTGVSLEQGETYQVSYDIRSSGNRTAYFKIGMSGGTYDVYNDEDLTLTSDWYYHSETFTMDLESDPYARIEFNIGLSTEDIYVDNISVKKGTTDTTPDPTPAATTGPGCTLPGDVDGDGSIDIIDALLIAQYYVQLNPANFNSDCADINCDQTITIVDALLIAQYYVGLITTFPC